jgi:hypothetical protein
MTMVMMIITMMAMLMMVTDEWICAIKIRFTQQQ